VLVGSTLTPTVSPTWTVSALVGRRIRLGASNWYSISANTATSATITSPPGNGTYAYLLGGAPIDSDIVVVAANNTVIVDADYTALTNGIAGLTITSHASTPGMLTFKSDGTAAVYGLKIKAGTTIVGTNAAAKGRLLANSDNVWGHTTAVPFASKNTILLDTTAYIDATYLDIALYGTQPTNYSVEVWGATYTVTGSGANDTLTATAPSTTPPQNGTPVTFTVNGGTLPSPLVAGTTYYTRDLSGSTLQVETSIGGGAINLTTDGSATIYMHYGCWGPVTQATAVNTTTGVVTWNGVPPAAGTAVVLKSSGTLPTGWSTDDVYYTRSISGNTCTLALQNSDATVIIPTDTGTGNISMYCGTPASTYATAAVAVLTDLTSDAGWVTTAGENAVALVNASNPGNYDQQRLTVSTINAKWLVLSANVDSVQFPGARVYLTSRNVRIQCNTTTAAQTIVTYGAATHTGVFQCEIRSTAGTGTTFYATGINAGGAVGAGHTISGVISGCSKGIYISPGATLTSTGIIVACSDGINGNGAYNAYVMNGTIAGCTTGMNAPVSPAVAGTICGCTNAISSGGPGILTGLIAGCNTAVASANNWQLNGTIRNCVTTVGNIAYRNDINGTIRGCGTVQQYSAQIHVSASIVGCGTGFYMAGVDLLGASFANNGVDLNVNMQYMHGVGTTLGSTSQVSNYKGSSSRNVDARTGVAIESGFGGVAGAIGFWTLGGYTKSATYSVGTHGTPPITPPNNLIHEMLFEYNGLFNWAEFHIWGLANKPVNVTFYGALTGTTTWTTRPNVGIYDPTKAWQVAGEILNASAAMASNTNWQTLTATYKPTYDRALLVRIQGIGGTSGGSGTEKLYWFHTVNLGGVPVSISPMQGSFR